MSALKDQLTNAMKEAMRAKDQHRLTVIRMALASLKQVEVDERIELDDARVLAILDKQIKQRIDASTQFRDAGRTDLSDKEDIEAAILREFMPAALSQDEINSAIDAAIAQVGETGMQAMGKVMAILKPQLQGRADLGAVSGQVKQRLV
ncbi:GatB/YqeY domain-containing protein [Alcanivorax sp. 1008]|uniref:GatB/YqeY domain-containing protein n=1 Tax=Alcanivorax sp. 1008 TaxID=2816853 RepID=UPI001DCBAE70|nr:GatB/YqeY domain-containing protein [Alcanivorax sp. 1008]